MEEVIDHKSTCMYKHNFKNMIKGSKGSGGSGVAPGYIVRGGKDIFGVQGAAPPDMGEADAFLVSKS